MTVINKPINPLIEYLEKNFSGRLVHKWQHYFDVYHQHFARFRGEPITMIEIGIFNGGSLKMWKDYFGPKSTIVGVDINPECKKFEEPGIEVVIGDQSDRKFLKTLAEKYPKFAVLVDDGGIEWNSKLELLRSYISLYVMMGYIFVRTPIHLICQFLEAEI